MLGSTLLIAVVESGLAFGVFLASSVLIGALFFDAGDGIVYISSINFDGSGS